MESGLIYRVIAKYLEVKKVRMPKADRAENWNIISAGSTLSPGNLKNK